MSLNSTAESIRSRSELTQEAIEAITLSLSANLADVGQGSATGGRAVLVLADGSQLRCKVNDISPRGAYFLRNQSSSTSSPRVRQGEQLKAFIFLPLVLLYQGWTYWVFRKRVTRSFIEKAAASAH